MPETVLFPYPHPKSLGLIFNPKEAATLESVEKGSIAEKSGFKAGDALTSLDLQPLVSIADVQWVLHNTPGEGRRVIARVMRDGKDERLILTLPAGWRRTGDISWRSSTWGMRRMATGGILLEDLSAEDRAKLNLPEGGMALRAKHVGQYGPHAAAKNAGFLVGDVIVEFDGKTDLTSESAVIVHGVTNRMPGDKVPVTIMRGGKKMKLTLPMQE